MYSANYGGADSWKSNSPYLVPVCNAIFRNVNTSTHLGWQRSRLPDGMPYWAEHNRVFGPQGVHEWVTFILPLMPDLYDLSVDFPDTDEEDDWEEEQVETEWQSLLCEGMQVFGQVLDSRPLFRHVDYLERQGALHFVADDRNGILLRLNDLAGRPITAVVVMITENGQPLANVLGPWRPFVQTPPPKATDRVRLWIRHDIKAPLSSETRP